MIILVGKDQGPPAGVGISFRYINGYEDTMPSKIMYFLKSFRDPVPSRPYLSLSGTGPGLELKIFGFISRDRKLAEISITCFCKEGAKISIGVSNGTRLGFWLI